jgi:hypothetical protein
VAVGAFTASDGARRPCGPTRHLAVHGARVVVALFGLVKVGAGDAAVECGLHNVAEAELLACAAYASAHAPCAEGADDTIDWAGLGIAGTGVRERRALGPSAGGADGDVAEAELDTVAAHGSAHAPATPRGRGTINIVDDGRAIVGVAGKFAS